MSGMRVMSKQCATCIFSNRSPISPERFQQLKEQWEAEGIQQECHHATMQQEQIACRGHYEAARAGKVNNYPLIAVAAGFGLVGLKIDDLMQICERIGWVTFVDLAGDES